MSSVIVAKLLIFLLSNL